ncbi:hypothetical protein N7478_005683 [Penicillium angulare]|uniref:uncharacterized protein n=1 Tax=Penicillium angulare TaxID=116970 RepID=UPI0025422C62|nr:uncharacterized protein N7478_005683 [Penicillium angulare]KAJ5280311.1 hypothetical protein N7478_005683 [Penicillium angulare]
MDAADRPSAPNALPQLTKVPIAQLSPTLEQSEGKCIEAAVTLVWPYSSSTKSFSLLLAEPDFRLRRSHGQVKTIFHGRAAEKLAASHVGIGDSVRVALKGSNYVANDTATQTPGRYVAWDVHFESELSLEVNRSSKDSLAIFIEEQSFSPHDSEQVPPSTPRVTSIDPESTTVVGQTSWDSPAFLRPRSNQFGGVLHASLNTSAEEDGFVPGKGRKRPRYSLKRDDWHLVEDPMSPQEKDEPGLDWWEKDSWEKMSEENADGEQEPEHVASVGDDTQISNPDVDAMDHTSSAHASREPSPVFIKPSMDISGGIFGRQPLQSNNTNTPSGPIAPSFQDRLIPASHCATDTPQLRPIPSPGLPIPSPIVSNSNYSEGYFSGVHLPSQTLNGDSVALEADASVAFPELISVTSIPPTTPSKETSIISEVAEETYQNNASTFAGADLITGQSTSPFTQTIESTSISGGLLPSQPGIIISSEDVRDATIETPFGFESVEEQHASFTDDQTEIQRMGLHVAQEQMGFEQESYMEYREYTQPSSASGVEAGPEDYETCENPDIALSTHNAVDTEVHGESHEVPAPESGDEKYYDDDDDDFSDASQVPQPHVAPGSNVSDNESLESEDESIDYEEDERMATNFDSRDDDDEDQWDGFSDDQSEAEELPKPPPAQPEVIVLDSDSEDELTSDQPMIPQSMHADHKKHQYSPPQSQSEDQEWGSGEEHVDSESDAEDDDEDEEDGHDRSTNMNLNERVHESDKEDESSVDVLARDHNIEQPWSQGTSVYGDHDERDAQYTGSVAISSKGYQSDDVIHSSVNTGSVIDLDSDSDEQASQADPSTFPREDSAPASRIEKAWSTKIIHTLDGAGDHDLDETASPMSVEEETIQKDIRTTLVNSADHQISTPGPTQEFVTGSRNAVNNEENEAIHSEVVEDVENIQESSTDPNAPSTSEADAVSIDMHVLTDAQVVSSHQEHTSMSTDALEPLPNESHAGDIFVVVPTTTTRPDEQPEAPQDHPLGVPKVIVTQLPVPDRHAHGLRSKLSYFAPLATLVDHYGSQIDTLSVVHETSPIVKATAGSKDYFMTIQLTDPSMAGTLLQAQIFRRYKSAMPTLVEGSAVLLRNFKVHSYDHSIMLVSVESSSWAVFDGSGPEAQVNGPPVEYNSEERAYATGLRNWYAEIGTHMVADHQLQTSIQEDDMDREGSAVLSETGSMDSMSRDPTSSARGSRRRKSYRRVTIHELRDGRRYTEVGSPSTKESIHELRDGTVYANL